MELVPKRWIKNIIEMMPNTMGTIGISGDMSCSPSMADVTVMAGVITPSAIIVLAPIMARMANHFLPRLRISVNSARIPPSPLLSARSATNTYFRVVCRVSVQNIHDTAPNI